MKNDKGRITGSKTDILVCGPLQPGMGYFANNPQFIITENDEIVLSFGMQHIDKLAVLKTHHHFQPVGVLHWAISRDQGNTWNITDVALPIGKITEASYGEPLLDGSMATISFTDPFKMPFSFIQRHKAGWMPYNNHLPCVSCAPLDDFGPFDNFWFHCMTRTGDKALLAGGYAYMTEDLLKDSKYPGHKRMTTVFLKSEDEGRSWKYVSYVPNDNMFSFDECGLLAGENGHVTAMLRTDWDPAIRAAWPPEARDGYGYHIYKSVSRDNGLSWSCPEDTGIWGHPPYLNRLKSGKILMTYGHRRDPHQIRAVVSHDGGNTWDLDNIKVIHTFEPGNYDFGYPQTTQLKDGTILCTYYGYTTKIVEGTLNPCGIYVSLFDEDWLFNK